MRYYSHFGITPWDASPLLGSLMALSFVIIFALKAFSLWHAARRQEKWWFVCLFIFNTAGILELIYLFFVVKISHRKHKGSHIKDAEVKKEE